MLSQETATAEAQPNPVNNIWAKPLPGWILWLAAQRATLVLLGLASAILLPGFSLHTGLPDVRIEQLLLPYAVFVLLVDWRQGQLEGLGYLDWIFGGLVLSTLLSIVFAPLILHARLSGRDFYELLKLALYFGLYRLALSAYRNGNRRRFAEIFSSRDSISAAFGIVQYFDLMQVNARLTPLFAPEHHLDVVVSAGRVVGTIGNPNYFGIFCVLLALLALVSYWLWSPRGLTMPSAPLGMILLAALLASVGLVMSGSRTALLALFAALLALLGFALVRYRFSHRLLRLFSGMMALGLMLILSVGLVELYPHGRLDYISRIAGSAVGEDASIGLRLARWRSLIDSWRTPPRQAGGNRHPVLTTVHPTGVAPGASDLVARDDQRKADLTRIATAIDSFHESTGRWPAPETLAADLVPRFMPALPSDPVTSEAYPDTPTVSGYSLSARLENPADPDYPIYGIGSSPNYVRNGDLERGGAKPADWDAIAGTQYSIRPRESLYGFQSVDFVGDSERSTDRTGIYQQHYFGRPGGKPFTATVWIKLLGPVWGRSSSTQT